MAGLSPSARRRLLGRLALLSSPVPGERDAAALAAARIVAEHDLRWADLIREADAPAPLLHYAQEPVGWRAEAAALLRQHHGLFNHVEYDFLHNITTCARISPKQAAWLRRLAEKARRAGAGRAA